MIYRTEPNKIMVKRIKYLISRNVINLTISFFCFLSLSFPQMYASADPYYLLAMDRALFDNEPHTQTTIMRPFYIDNGQPWSIRFRSEQYLNDNAPNQENMDVRYFGKGFTVFNSFHMSFYNDFLAFSFEPYILKGENKTVKIYDRPGSFAVLNDVPKDIGTHFTKAGLRDAQLYLHFKGFGIGISNAGMWWGPGIQGTLSMTNNTIGFPHYMIGTIRELRWRRMGFMGRYTFAEIARKPYVDPTYFTSLTGIISFYVNPIISIGFSRNYLSGGVDVGTPWTAEKAALIVFESFLIENNFNNDYTIGGHDPFDQTLSGYFSMWYPDSKLKLYLEIGFNDNRQNFWDFVVQPDHAMATIIGFQHHKFLGNDNLIFGFEYANLINGRMQVFRVTPPWYNRSHYDHFSYEGRRWGAHSGSDSDDLLIFFGWMGDKWTIIPMWNYERHGVTTYRPNEIKSELRLDTRYKISNQIQLGVYYEWQYEAHLGFPKDHYFINEITGERRTNTLIIRFEYAIRNYIKS